MAGYTLSVAPNDKPLQLLISSFKNLLTPTVTVSESTPAVSQLVLSNADTVAGTNTIVSHLSTLIPAFKEDQYTDLEKAEIAQWLTLTASSPIIEDTLRLLNDELKLRTTILGEKPSIADVVMYARLKDDVAGWTDDQRTGETGYRNIVRWVDFIQNSPVFGLNLPEGEKVKIDPSKVLVYLKPEEAVKEKKKEGAEGEKKVKGRAGAAEKAKEKVVEAKEVVKEEVNKAATAVAGDGKKQQKKEKKEKGPRREAPPKEEPVLSPYQIDLRVGHVLYCTPHPNADSLFVSTIAMGDPADSALVTPPGTLTLPESVLAAHNPLPPVRTVCSGLNGLVPLEAMQNRKVVVVANLKPVTMRGVKSAAMVLAASPVGDDHGKVELVAPPEGAVAGERVYFEGYKGEPEAVLNPKKKIWEAIQPGFSTSEENEVIFDRSKAGWEGDAAKGKAPGEGPVGKLMVEGKGTCRVESLKGATVR
ncbi:nucleic acid-binding protein [Morchella conica CCBAS932]|uniref:Nucleic acid-binding protein n=1 Tax=Morchella conica CCBAS932 TaxID=1392247 RepID=A0A3N4KI49_9PEZI|nr:nucleic acid-binding protein [Morchella conica CCBAS932]